MRKVNALILLAIFVVLPVVVFFSGRVRSDSDFEPIPYDPQDTRKLGYPDFVNEVRRESGITVGSVTELKGSRKFIANSKSWTFKVADDLIFMAEFSSKEEADAAFKKFDDSGYVYEDSGNVSSLLWPESPRLFRRDNIIIVYSGTNSEVKDMMEDLLGDNIEI
jgi:hypothetical protein